MPLSYKRGGYKRRTPEDAETHTAHGHEASFEQSEADSDLEEDATHLPAERETAWEHQEISGSTTQAAYTADRGQYAEELGLTGDAISCLYQMPEDTLAAVRAEFHLTPGARDPSALFISFAQKKHRNMTGVFLDWERVGTYAEELGLNEAAVRCLHRLPRETLAAVKDKFFLTPGARDPSALFIACAHREHKAIFGEKLRWQSGRRAEQTEHATTAAASAPEDAIEQYAHDWGFSEDAVLCLQSLDSSTLEKVMSSFQPSTSTTDVSAKLISYASSVHLKLTGQKLRGPWLSKRSRPDDSAY